jgi:hypothetical protein
LAASSAAFARSGSHRGKKRGVVFGHGLVVFCGGEKSERWLTIFVEVILMRAMERSPTKEKTSSLNLPNNMIFIKVLKRPSKH